MSNYADGKFDTPYGPVHMSNPGPKNDPPYDNVNRYDRPEGDVVLQGPALRAFKAAELRATPRRMRRRGKVRPILISGVGYRSYAYQKLLYETSDIPGRYADPDGSMHVEALAVDIDTSQSYLRKRRIKKALEAEGWHYGVPGESWHASFKLSG